MLGTGPGVWGRGAEKSHQWDFCAARERAAYGPSQECPALAHLPLSSLDLPVAPTPPPSQESWPVDQSRPALLGPSRPLGRISPEEYDHSFPRDLPAREWPSGGGAPPALTVLSAAWAVSDQGMCWWLLEATDLVPRADGNWLGTQRPDGPGVAGKKEPFLPSPSGTLGRRLHLLGRELSPPSLQPSWGPASPSSSSPLRVKKLLQGDHPPSHRAALFHGLSGTWCLSDKLRG